MQFEKVTRKRRASGEGASCSRARPNPPATRRVWDETSLTYFGRRVPDIAAELVASCMALAESRFVGPAISDAQKRLSAPVAVYEDKLRSCHIIGDEEGRPYLMARSSRIAAG